MYIEKRHKALASSLLWLDGVLGIGALKFESTLRQDFVFLEIGPYSIVPLLEFCFVSFEVNVLIKLQSVIEETYA